MPESTDIDREYERVAAGLAAYAPRTAPADERERSARPRSKLRLGRAGNVPSARGSSAKPVTVRTLRDDSGVYAEATLPAVVYPHPERHGKFLKLCAVLAVRLWPLGDALQPNKANRGRVRAGQTVAPTYSAYVAHGSGAALSELVLSGLLTESHFDAPARVTSSDLKPWTGGRSGVDADPRRLPPQPAEFRRVVRPAVADVGSPGTADVVHDNPALAAELPSYDRRVTKPPAKPSTPRRYPAGFSPRKPSDGFTPADRVGATVVAEMPTDRPPAARGEDTLEWRAGRLGFQWDGSGI